MHSEDTIQLVIGAYVLEIFIEGNPQYFTLPFGLLKYERELIRFNKYFLFKTQKLF